MSKKNPNSNKKSGGAGFIITLLILSSMSGFSFGGIIAGVLLGLGIGKIASIMGSGLDTTTHNRRDRERQAREEAVARQQALVRARQLAAEAEARKQADENRIPLTGDKIADAVITTGQDMLNTIKRENAAIPDQELTEQMNNLAVKCEQIFRTVSETPSKAPQVRKFMNYYLPTTLKMLANYRTMQQRGVSYGEMKEARDTTVHGMNLILTACQKQIDNLHRENMLDISTDIEEAQAYDAAGVNDRIKEAVRSTRGQIICYEGEPIYAWFHAHAGGRTATAAEGLSYKKEAPYTQSVESRESEKAPEDDTAWTASFPGEEAVRAAAETGVKISAHVRQIRMGEKGESGRVKEILINNQSVPANEFRIAIGSEKMKSTLLTEVNYENDTLTLSGKGYGHGVGMSQWGAYAMAEEGKDAREIIQRYFRGVDIVQMWK